MEALLTVFPFTPENLVSRDRFGRPVPRQPVHNPQPGSISGVYSRAPINSQLCELRIDYLIEDG